MKQSKEQLEDIEIVRNISKSSKWTKEIAGIPTYIAAGILSVTAKNIVVSCIEFISFVMIYHYIYAHLFPGLNAVTRTKLIIFVLAQLFIWAVVLIGINYYLSV